MGKERSISTDALGKISRSLYCRIEDIVEDIPDEEDIKGWKWEPYSDWELYGSFLTRIFTYMEKRQVDAAPVSR